MSIRLSNILFKLLTSQLFNNNNKPWHTQFYVINFFRFLFFLHIFYFHYLHFITYFLLQHWQNNFFYSFSSLFLCRYSIHSTIVKGFVFVAVKRVTCVVYVYKITLTDSAKQKKKKNGTNAQINA